jgi:mRNA-degrading endonuclease RelE of RelBE toxin-antitoxin system
LRHFASPEFWKRLESLPEETQKLAHENFELMRLDPRHPSLHLKRVSGFWSVRVGIHYRAIGKELPDGILWGWIGSHAEYDRLLR